MKRHLPRTARPLALLAIVFALVLALAPTADAQSRGATDVSNDAPATLDIGKWSVDFGNGMTYAQAKFRNLYAYPYSEYVVGVEFPETGYSNDLVIRLDGSKTRTATFWYQSSFTQRTICHGASISMNYATDTLKVGIPNRCFGVHDDDYLSLHRGYFFFDTASYTDSEFAQGWPDGSPRYQDHSNKLLVNRG